MVFSATSSVHIPCDDKEEDHSFGSEGPEEEEKETSHLLATDCSIDFSGSNDDEEEKDDEACSPTSPRHSTSRKQAETAQRRRSTRCVLVTSLCIAIVAMVILTSLFRLVYTGSHSVIPTDTSETPWERPDRYRHHGQKEDIEGKDPAEYQFNTKEDIEAKIAWDREQYFEEMDGWKKFSWIPPKSHSSLSSFIEALSPEEQELRVWVERVHHGLPGRSVGLQANPNDPSFDELSWPLQPFPDSPDLPAERRGANEKWERLRKQAASPGDAGMCGTNDWLSRYHSDHRRMLTGELPGEFIIYHCERNTGCGGMADRILGMTGSFFLALIQKRAWLAEWQAPVPLDVLFDSPRIDWAYSAFDDGSTHTALRDPKLTSMARDLHTVRARTDRLDNLFNTKDWTNKSEALLSEADRESLASPWINFYTNRGMVLRTFDYPDLRETIDELGVTRENVYGCILSYLFKPKPPMLSYIALHTSVLALPTVFSIGIQVRTGDQSMISEDADANNTYALHQDYFRCARELGETYALPNQKVIYYLVTDSEFLKEDAAKVLGDQLVLTDVRPGHVDVSSGHHDAADGVFGALSEAWILSKTDMRVQTSMSGFGKIATFASGLDNTSVSIMPVHRRNPLRPSPDWNPDCRLPEAIIGFSKLAKTWSLGR